MTDKIIKSPNVVLGPPVIIGEQQASNFYECPKAYYILANGELICKESCEVECPIQKK